MSRRTAKGDLVLDPSLGDPRAAAALAAAARRDAGALVSALGALDDQAHLDAVLVMLGDQSVRPTVEVWHWVSGAGTADPAGRTVLGALLLADGALDDAVTVLWGVVSEHPAAGAAWRCLIEAGQLQGRSKEELATWFGACDAASPMFLPACRAYVRALGERWGGSSARALAFARWASDRCADGHLGPVLIADAHFERIVTGPVVPAPPDVIAEVRTALDRTRLAASDWGSDLQGIAARNQFAATAHRMGDVEVASHLIGLIGRRGDRVTPHPWRWFGDPADSFHIAGRMHDLW